MQKMKHLGEIAVSIIWAFTSSKICYDYAIEIWQVDIRSFKESNFIRKPTETLTKALFLVKK